MGAVLLLVSLACGPTRPAGLQQPLSGKITLENQHQHDWILMVLTGADTVITTATDPDGAYTIPVLEDGLWAVNIRFPYYVPITDTLEVIDGRVMRSIGDRMLTQALRVQTATDKITYVLGDSVHIFITVQSLISEPFTVISPYCSGLLYLVRQDTHTLVRVRCILPVISSRTFQPGEIVTRKVLVPWVPGQFPDETPVAPGLYTIYALWDSLERHFTYPPESDPAAEAFLRTIGSRQIKLTVPPS
jgi:hypothetical protein